MKKLFLLVITLFAFISAKAEDKFPIGIIIPLTGAASSMGESIKGAFLTYSFPNLALHFEDDQCDPKRAIAAYNKLSRDGVKIFYVGCSGSIMALAPIVKAKGDLIVTSYSGSSAVRTTGPEVIRFNPDAISIAEAFEKLFKTNQYYASFSRVVLLYEEQDYATSLADLLKEKLSGREIITEPYLVTQTSFKSEILRLKEKGDAVVIFIPVSDKTAAILYKEMKELGFTTPILGEVNLCDYAVKPSNFGLHGACLASEFVTESARVFEARYKEANGRASQYPFYDAITADIAEILNVYAASHPVTPKDLAAFLLRGVKGLVTNYTFSSDGEVLNGGEYLTLKKF